MYFSTKKCYDNCYNLKIFTEGLDVKLYPVKVQNHGPFANTEHVFSHPEMLFCCHYLGALELITQELRYKKIDEGDFTGMLIEFFDTQKEDNKISSLQHNHFIRTINYVVSLIQLNDISELSYNMRSNVVGIVHEISYLFTLNIELNLRIMDEKIKLKSLGLDSKFPNDFEFNLVAKNNHKIEVLKKLLEKCIPKIPNQLKCLDPHI
jgi:hypothetical protein